MFLAVLRSHWFHHVGVFRFTGDLRFVAHLKLIEKVWKTGFYVKSVDLTLKSSRDTIWTTGSTTTSSMNSSSSPSSGENSVAGIHVWSPEFRSETFWITRWQSPSLNSEKIVSPLWIHSHRAASGDAGQDNVTFWPSCTTLKRYENKSLFDFCAFSLLQISYNRLGEWSPDTITKTETRTKTDFRHMFQVTIFAKTGALLWCHFHK